MKWLAVALALLVIAAIVAMDGLTRGGLWKNAAWQSLRSL